MIKEQLKTDILSGYFIMTGKEFKQLIRNIMGTYTELILGCRLKKETPDNVIETLKWMARLSKKEPARLAFKTKSGRNPLTGYICHYFGIIEPQAPIFKFNKIAESWFLGSRAALKNYENEIEDFLEWIKPFIEQGSGENNIYAIVIGEHSEEPVIYYNGEDGE